MISVIVSMFPNVAGGNDKAFESADGFVGVTDSGEATKTDAPQERRNTIQTIQISHKIEIYGIFQQ